MATLLKIITVFICTILILISIAGFGFHIKPKSFPPHPETTPDYNTVPLPSDLPEPVQYYSKTILGDQVPEIASTVIWGRAKCKIYDIWMPVRFKAYYIPGQEFYRYMEITWYGYPILKGCDSYTDGEGVFKAEGVFALDQSDEKISQGQNLAMWAESVLMPSVFITDPNIHWEAVNDTSARLVVPLKAEEDSLQVRFDQQTGFITQMSALRYRNQEEDKISWLIEYSNWKSFHSVMIPTQFAMRWEDESTPYSFWTIEGVEYNVKHDLPLLE